MRYKAGVIIHEGSEWRKIYIGKEAATRYMDRLKAAYPDMEFKIANHTYLDLE